MATEKLSETITLDNKYVMHTYGKQPVVFVKGEGCYVWDENGKKYLDLVAGIAVNGLGHCPKVVVDAIKKQAGVLMHTSNLYYTPGQPRLAKLLVDLSDMDKVFFCNSGAEANEAAIKLARKASGDSEKYEIITAEHSFHGRTMGAITATGQPKYQKSFMPLVPGFKYVAYNDVNALKKAVNKNTCAVMMEPVQGESGVHPATTEFLQEARKLCDEVGAALIFDEVQTGLGRTGKLFGYQLHGIIPDIMTLAKTLGGGFPIGACLARGRYADVFVPGDHASTFGGNPLASAAGEAAVREIAEGGWVENAAKVGEYFRNRLSELPDVKEIRGVGLMVAVEFHVKNAKAIASAAMDKGLILNAISDTTIRFVPPLILTCGQVDDAMKILAETIAESN